MWQLRHLPQWSSASHAEGRQLDPGLLYFGKLICSQKVGLACSQRKHQLFCGRARTIIATLQRTRIMFFWKSLYEGVADAKLLGRACSEEMIPEECRSQGLAEFGLNLVSFEFDFDFLQVPRMESATKENEAREIRTPNLLIWSQTRYRCAIAPHAFTFHELYIPIRNSCLS